MRKLLVLLAILAIAFVAPHARAVTYTLTDLNSVFIVDTQDTPGQWTVDGVQQLYQQGFWWRVGATGGEASIGGLYSSAIQSLPNTLQIDYNLDPRFEVRVTYVLTGGSLGSNTSDVAETIRIHNKQSDALGMHFFQYADFDLGGTANDDELSFPNPNLVDQRDLGGSANLSETVIVPSAQHHEGSLYPDLINRLNDNSPTTLSDLPAYGGGSITGDVVWGFEWDQSIGTSDFIISKDKHLSAIPEPGTLVLLGFGLLGAEVARRRRNRR